MYKPYRFIYIILQNDDTGEVFTVRTISSLPITMTLPQKAYIVLQVN